MTDRRKRTTRQRRISGTVTQKDYSRLTLIGLLGFAQADQIARELDARVKDPREACTRRLRRLYDMGLLNKWLIDSRKPDLYSLTRDGLCVLRAESPAVAARVRLPGVPKVATLGHKLGIADGRLHLVGLARAGWFCRDRNRTLRILRRVDPLGSGHRKILLECATPPAGPRCSVRWSSGADAYARGLGLGSLRPDGLMRIAHGADVHCGFVPANPSGFIEHAALEVDTGAETLRVLAKKAQRYRGVMLAGLLQSVVFALCGSGPRRAGHVARVLAENGVCDAGDVYVIDRELTHVRPYAPLPEPIGVQTPTHAPRPQRQGEARPPTPVAYGARSQKELEDAGAKHAESGVLRGVRPASVPQVDPHIAPQGGRRRG